MPSSGDEGWRYLRERFGVARDRLEDLTLWESGGDLWIGAPQLPSGMRTETVGIRMLRSREEGFKPTTYGLQFLGPRLERNRAEVTRRELARLLRGDLLPWAGEEEGYVALVYRGRVVGCGLFRDGQLSSRIPKARAQELQDILAAAG